MFPPPAVGAAKSGESVLATKYRCWTRTSLALFLLGIFILSALLPNNLPFVRAQASSSIGSIAPSTYPLLFGSSGSVRIDIPKPGIAVRIEVPREFLQGVVSGENDTHFITSNIRNDYYYYNLVDESRHWTYDWRGTNSTGPCFKPNFSYYDANAPYCLEIWNYLNYPAFKQPNPNVDYCADKNEDQYVFNCFTAPKFVLFNNLASPTLAGLYNFTLFIANRTNTLGYPDFVHAYNTTLFVPVSMAYNAGFISGNICDGIGMAGTALSCVGPIRGKGIVYAMKCLSSPCSIKNATIVARAYVDQSLCQVSSSSCGRFNLTGLAPGSYLVEGSAGLDQPLTYSLTPLASTPIAYSLTPYGYPTPQPLVVSANQGSSILPLALRRAPLVCGAIHYENQYGNVPSGANSIRSLTDQSYLLAAGFGFGNPNFELNVTVEGTDPFGHVFRYEGVSADTTSGDSFNLTTGVGVKYVRTDPYGTEYAGLPAPEDVGPSGYTLSVNVWVSGYIQLTIETATISQSPGFLIPTCSDQPTVSPNPVIVRMGGIITGTLQFCNTQPTCTLESPQEAEESATDTTTGALFGGNIIVQAYDASGILRGVTIINGTVANGQTYYPPSIRVDDNNSLRFYVTGFSEYYNHSLSGTWKEHDYGLPDSTYTLQVYVRGYELTSTSPASFIVSGFNQTVSVDMTRGGAFQVEVGSYDNRFGIGNNTRSVQANLPWRFLNSSIPVRARVYFYASNGATVGYVEALMTNRTNNLANEIGVISFTNYTFTVIFAGQNWSLREIWFYGLVPTCVTNDNYTILAYTLGYVRQFPNGIILPNQLVGFGQVFVTLFIANEVDITVPIFANPQTLTKTSEYDHAIGQVFSGPLFGAEMANLTAGTPTLQFNIFGFGAMELSNATECTTKDNDEPPRTLDLCGQGHFFYVAPDGTRSFDYGLDVGSYTAALNQPQSQFGFLIHFLQVLNFTTLPVVKFTDLFLEQGVSIQVIQMASIMQGPSSVVQGFCNGSCLPNPPSEAVPLSWAHVQASNSTYSQSAPTFDGMYDGVGALFLPMGTYNVTFTDVQYQSQTVNNFPVQWGSSYSLLPPQPLCPTGTTCP